MKSIPLQSNHRPSPRHNDRSRDETRHFPQTDCHYQATVNAVSPSQRRLEGVGPVDLRAFRKISSDFMAGETHRDYAAEAALFALVTGIAAWPIISMLIVLAQTAGG